MSRHFSVVALLLLGCSCQAQTDARILSAIGQVEGGVRLQRGDSGRAHGLYQVHPEAWATGNAQLTKEGRKTYSLRGWKDPTAQDMVAAALLRYLRGRLQADGIPDPTPEQLALCWGMGYAGAKSVGFSVDQAPTAKASYARRVGNLARMK
jgi:hypothetical protein